MYQLSLLDFEFNDEVILYLFVLLFKLLCGKFLVCSYYVGIYILFICLYFSFDFCLGWGCLLFGVFFVEVFYVIFEVMSVLIVVIS